MSEAGNIKSKELGFWSPETSYSPLLQRVADTNIFLGFAVGKRMLQKENKKEKGVVY